MLFFEDVRSTREFTAQPPGSTKDAQWLVILKLRAEEMLT